LGIKAAPRKAAIFSNWCINFQSLPCVNLHPLLTTITKSLGELMGLFNLIAKIFGSNPLPKQAPGLGRPSPEHQSNGRSTSNVTVTITSTFSTQTLPEVSEAEIAERAKQYFFVASNSLPALKSADQWWSEKANKRRLGDNSPKAYEWLEPFVSREFIQTLQVPTVLERGPGAIDQALKAIRVLIRARRKEKAPFDDLLKELYGAAVLSHLFLSLKTSFTGHWRMTEYVNINDVKGLRIDYSQLGYQCIETLGKTDVKWLVEVFGEPAEHQSLASYRPDIRQNAISRLCWEDLNRSNEAAQAVSSPRTSMQEWINGRLKSEIGYYKEWQERVATQKERQAELTDSLDASWAAAKGTLIVADLETTGLDAEQNEILEFGAVRVSPAGEIEAEFSMLVRINSPVPANITCLTGITQELVNREGLPLEDAMKAFVVFVGSYPVFFHNAPFDVRFLQKAALASRMRVSNIVHDTLPLARCAWPLLESYKLRSLAEHVGASVTPEHRALADVRATLAVLLAAREKHMAVT
jgi:DNA polymerase-3 subunit epsilon